MNKILVFTEQTTPRVKYIFDLLLRDLLGLTYEITSDKNEFTHAAIPKFSYSSVPVGTEIFFQSADLLFEASNRPQPINFCQYEKLRGFYPVTSAQSQVPFDMFASAFFMLTRYEEYFPSQKDKHGRFRPSSSMITKGGFLEKPMVNYYALELKKSLSAKYPALTFSAKSFQYIPTFDIDMAYSYLHKGWVKNIGGYIRSFFLSDFKDIKNRTQVLLSRRKDPFDSYDFIFRVCRQNQLNSIFFFLLGDESRFDKNISHEVPPFQKLICSVASQADTGIHLSYKSHVSSHRSKMEIDRLESVLQQPVQRNRFHYLRFQIPDTMERLLKLGVTEDYSMGYASKNGFRAGICTPFLFFNIHKNEVTGLKIFPFAFMDTTFTHYQRTDPETALNEIRQLMRLVYETGGTFYGLWHNSSFTEQNEWKGYRHIFETVAQEAAALTQQP